MRRSVDANRLSRPVGAHANDWADPNPARWAGLKDLGPLARKTAVNLQTTSDSSWEKRSRVSRQIFHRSWGRRAPAKGLEWQSSTSWRRTDHCRMTMVIVTEEPYV